ncbi:ABC transporter ATP-binding protein [Caulobacter sp. KR2-114]|uniref:ABC transporter ATP-binding protein n=1 Tax=Caulobacter sp. KR2-114 TaxID=3400912 RepID=UPI003C0684FD
MSMIELQSVAKSYRKGSQAVSVLREVNLQVEAGEFLALVGPSGSGKSTLLNIIGGLDHATSGEVLVAGARLDRLSGGALTQWRAKHVGFVFQFYNLMPTLSAEQNVELPLLLSSGTARDRRARVDAALELVGLADRRRHKPNELSGGQQQRVAIARAIVTDPAVLICDEPTGDLDRDAADQILELLDALRRLRGTTIVMVTHDLKAAEAAGRTVRLEKGELIEPPVAEAA